MSIPAKLCIFITACRPKIAIVIEASTKSGIQQFRGIYKDVVKRITDNLATLPYQPGDGEGTGASIVMFPFATSPRLVDLNTVGKKPSELVGMLDDFFESQECTQGSDLLEAYKLGSKEAYLMGKSCLYWMFLSVYSLVTAFYIQSYICFIFTAKRKKSEGFVIVLSNGIDSDTSDEHLTMFDTIYKKNQARGEFMWRTSYYCLYNFKQL